MKRNPITPPAGTILLLTTLLCIQSACTTASHHWRGTPYDPPQPAPDIEVAYRDFSLAQQRGKITLLYFGYTYCPDVCPATAAIMSQVFNQLEADPEELQFIMISVDPERETPESVQSYIQRFHPDFIGLWIERQQLEQVQEAYGIVAIREPSDDPNTYLITHTARVFLIDQTGNLRAHYPFGSSPEEFISDIEYLLMGSGK